MFTSVHSHYSIDKSAQVMGLGTDHIVKVPVDDIGRMKVDELGMDRCFVLENESFLILHILERLIKISIEKGETPFFVNATAGTTVLVNKEKKSVWGGFLRFY